jgi:hypothetical protein
VPNFVNREINNFSVVVCPIGRPFILISLALEVQGGTDGWTDGPLATQACMRVRVRVRVCVCVRARVFLELISIYLYRITVNVE